MWVRRSTSVSSTRARDAWPARARIEKTLPASSSEVQSATGTMTRSAACSALRVSASRSLLVSTITRPGHSVRSRMRRSVSRILGARLQQRGVRRRRHEVHAVLAHVDQPLEAALGPAVLEVAFADRLALEAEHALDHALVVEREDQDRQVFVQRAQVDREIGRRPWSCRRRPCSTRPRARARAAPDLRRNRIGTGARRGGIRQTRRPMYPTERDAPEPVGLWCGQCGPSA